MSWFVSSHAGFIPKRVLKSSFKGRRSKGRRPRRRWFSQLQYVEREEKKVKLSRYTPWRHMGGEEV
jgi:hypothetical protein